MICNFCSSVYFHSNRNWIRVVASEAGTSPCHYITSNYRKQKENKQINLINEPTENEWQPKTSPDFFSVLRHLTMMYTIKVDIRTIDKAYPLLVVCMQSAVLCHWRKPLRKHNSNFFFLLLLFSFTLSASRWKCAIFSDTKVHISPSPGDLGERDCALSTLTFNIK